LGLTAFGGLEAVQKQQPADKPGLVRSAIHALLYAYFVAIAAAAVPFVLRHCNG